MSTMTPEILPHSTGSTNKTAGIVLIILGLLALFLPLVAGVAITAVVGWVLVLAGAAHFYFGYHARTTGAVVWQCLIGLVYVVVGFFLVVHPARALPQLTILLAAYFVIEGAFELVLYFRLRAGHRASWFLWDGLITLILGIMIWAQWPYSSVWALGTIVGISLLMSGFARLQFRSGRPGLLP
ncbi:HdeD family acid-resistance protein [Acidipila sp. EB88]|uniref:HdeD family acid-resistance protein n=1 Tax=Acidipila sp. EB88 TaxID=2305226 RepID=UPI000F5F2771|nr:DUF308 domain-containing protein [Acidipila sp. EB88]RRA48800.1 hypothetical protein D1Y84_11405 [Acidipila sp. EB88]